MFPLPLGRRLLPLAAAAALAVGIFAASSPSVAAAAEPVTLTCTPVAQVSGITLCHEGFEIQIAQRNPDGTISGRARLAGAWHSFTGQMTAVKAVVVLIGANDYGLVDVPG